MHETTLYNGLVLQHNLVTVTALEALLIVVTSMRAVLDLLEVPYHAEFPYGCDQVALLFTIFGNLQNENRLSFMCINYIRKNVRKYNLFKEHTCNTNTEYHSSKSLS